MRLEYLFGSSVRASALETLSATSAPLSAYRVAKVIGAQPIQVLTIFRALQPDVVRRSPEGWTLTNDTLRRFLRDELHRKEAERRAEKDSLLARHGMRPRSRHGRS